MTKPAAWQFGGTSHFRKRLDPKRPDAKGWRPLYAAPQIGEWKDLTDEEVSRIYNSDEWEYGYELIYLAQAMLKEKNFGR